MQPPRANPERQLNRLLRTSLEATPCYFGDRRFWAKVGEFSEVSIPNLYAPSASGDLLWNGEMIVMRTIENPAYPLGELVRSEQPLRLYDLDGR